MGEIMKESVVLVPENYLSLWRIVEDALKRVFIGKGHQRHGDNKKFEEQDICVFIKEEGWGFAVGQARKKINEAKKMLANGEKEKAVDEIIDAAIYILAIAVVTREK